jgi:dihydropteroate synthase
VNAWKLARCEIALNRPRILGILNVTPDSFADGGRYSDLAAAEVAALDMARQGADAIDIGGESTRPGSEPVDAEEQIRRVVPVVERLRRAGLQTPVTVDTTLAAVAAAALDAGANGVNDVSAGRDDPAMFAAVASRGAGVVLMHRLVSPCADRYSDQYARAPEYGDVVRDVGAFLRERVTAAVAAGVSRDAIVVDPGLGFGKSVEQNLELLDRTAELAGGMPLLSALSRKSFVGRVWLKRDSEPSERLEGTLAMSERHLRAGAMLFRVHDVAEHRRVLDAAWESLRR